MLKNLKYFLFCLTIYVFLFHSSLAASENLITLNLKHRALFITCCDFVGTGLKDIVAMDEHNISIFRQNLNQSFKIYTTNSNDQIIAVNSCKIDKTGREILICLGKNKIFYFFLNNQGEIKGPNYIELPKDKPIFLEKQKGIQNYSFTVDLNNDGLDDIVIPSREGLFIFWQIESLIFKPSFVEIGNISIDTSLNIQPWPKFGGKSKESNKGISFFPTLSKKRYYWLQDYNRDGLLDIIFFTENSDSCQLGVLIQKEKREFQPPKFISLPSNKYQNWSLGELRLLDLNNDGFLDIIETNIEYPLRGNTSFLPLIIGKIYFAREAFEFNFQPKNIFKSVFIPGLDNIMNLDNNGNYGIITAPPPLKLESKESLIKVAQKKEIIFNLGYYVIKNQGKPFSYVVLSKDFSMTLPGSTEFDNFRQFIKFEDITDDGVPDILFLKKPSLLEITALKKMDEILSIGKTIKIDLPCSVTEIKTIDINSEGKKELLLLGQNGKTIYVIYLRGL